MMSEIGVTRLAIRWYVLALQAQQESEEKAKDIFSKANAFIYVLKLSKKRQQTLKGHAEKLLNTWMQERQSKKY